MKTAILVDGGFYRRRAFVAYGDKSRKFDSPINQKTLAGPIKPVFFCQISFNLL